MSILIKGMEMPKSCWDCPLINTKPCPCKGYSTALEHVTDRHADCPFVPVPPHGRLVDADKLGFAMMDAANADQALAMVDDAPTVIESEEGE